MVRRIWEAVPCNDSEVDVVARALAEVSALDIETRLNQRYEKFRKMGSVGIIEG